MDNRILFETLDPTLEFEVFGDCKLGASIVVQYILDASDEFIACPTWGIRSSVAVLEVAAILIDELLSATTVSLACGLLENMAQSFYIFFDDNYGVFVPFLRRVSHHLDAAEKTGKSNRITNMLDMLKEANYGRTDLQIFQIKRLYDTSEGAICTNRVQSLFQCQLHFQQYLSRTTLRSHPYQSGR
jgi:hypothetical protein